MDSYIKNIKKICNSDIIINTFLSDVNNKKIRNVNIRWFNEILKILNKKKEKNIKYYIQLFNASKKYNPNLFTYSIILLFISKYNYLEWKKAYNLLIYMIKQRVVPNKYHINPVINAFSKNKNMVLNDLLSIIQIFKKVNFIPDAFTLSALFKSLNNIKITIKSKHIYVKKWLIEYGTTIEINKYIYHELNNLFSKNELNNLLINYKNKTLDKVDKKSSNVFAPSFIEKNINQISYSDEEIKNEIIVIKTKVKVKNKLKINKKRKGFNNNIIRDPFGPSKENFKMFNGRRIIPKIF